MTRALPVTEIKERLRAAHARDLKAAIEGNYDSDRIFTDALECLEGLERGYWGVTRCCPRCGYTVDTQ